MKKLLFITALSCVVFPITAMRVPGRAVARIFAMHGQGLHTTDNDINALARKFPGEKFEKGMREIEDSDALKKLLPLCEKKAEAFECKAARTESNKPYVVGIAGVGTGAGFLSYGFFALNDACFLGGMAAFIGSFLVIEVIAHKNSLNLMNAWSSRRNLKALRSQIERAEELQDARRD